MDGVHVVWHRRGWICWQTPCGHLHVRPDTWKVSDLFPCNQCEVKA